MSTPKPLGKVERTKARVTRTETAAEAAREDLRASVAAALEEGISATEIATVLGVSRQRVYQMKQGANA